MFINSAVSSEKIASVAAKAANVMNPAVRQTKDPYLHILKFVESDKTMAMPVKIAAVLERINGTGYQLPAKFEKFSSMSFV